MMSLRSFSRALPRSLPKASPRCALRSFSAVPRPFLQNQALKVAPRQQKLATFSTSGAAWEKEGQVDQELSAKIESELQMEQEIRDSEKLPANISDYLDSSSFEVKPNSLPFPFPQLLPTKQKRKRHSSANPRPCFPKLHDTPGHEEVVLTRKFGDENIRVSFSIADLNAGMDAEDDAFDDDKALYDEPDPSDMEAMNAQSGGGNTKGAINTGTTAGGNYNMAPQDGVTPAGRDSLVDDESASSAEKDPNAEPSFPARINVMVEKPGKGTLQIETTAQDGEIAIDNVFYFANAELADAQTAEMEWKRRNLYEGPPFGNLDEDLQVLLERYLDERGVNTALALWVPEYIDFKEQREYLGWLSNVKAFVDA